jgi:hypothetical protein
MDYPQILTALSDRGIRFAVAGGFACLAQPIGRSQATSAEELLRLAEEKPMQALSWVHGSQVFLIVDLLIGEPFGWSEDLVQRMSMFGVEAPVLRKPELIRLKRIAGREVADASFRRWTVRLLIRFEATADPMRADP